MRRRWVGCVLLLALAVLCQAMLTAAWKAHCARWDMERVSYACPDGMEFSALKDLRRQIGLSGSGAVTGWSEAISADLEVDSTGASAEADAVYLDGDAARAFRPRLLDGQLPAAGDGTGCAIDEATALKLFGSADVVGRELTVGGIRMEIRGVFAPPDPDRGLALCPAALADEDLELAALEFMLWPEGGKTPLERAQSLTAAAGLDGSGSFNDHRDERLLLKWLAELPMALIRLAVLIELLWALRRWASAKIPERLSWLPGAAFWALAGLMVALLPGAGRPPISMLPSRWSDFAFWPEIVKSWRGAAAELLLSGTTRLRLMELTSAASVIGISLLSILLSLCAWRALRKLVNQTI